MTVVYGGVSLLRDARAHARKLRRCRRSSQICAPACTRGDNCGVAVLYSRTWSAMVPLMDQLVASLSDLDVFKIRCSVPNLRGPITQAGFAARFGFNAATVRDWEQRRRRPAGAARTLLAMIAADPVQTEWLLQRAAVQQDAGRNAAVHVGEIICDAIAEAERPAMPMEPRARLSAHGPAR